MNDLLNKKTISNCDEVAIKIDEPLKKWSGQRGSNPRPSRWQRDALPLSYARIHNNNFNIQILDFNDN